jgi:signal transduction histidine kinase
MSLLMLGLLVLGVLVFQQLVASLVFDRDSELGDLAALDLRLELREYSAALRSVASTPGLLSSSPEARLAALNDVANRRQQLYAGMALLDVDGQIVEVAPDSILPCISTAIQSDLYPAQALYDVLISNVIIDPQTGDSEVAIGTTLFDESGRSAGILLGCVHMHDAEMIDLLASLVVGGSGYAYLVDRHGRAIFHPDPAALGSDFSDRSYVQQVIAGEAGGTLWDSPEGDRWIVDYTPIPEVGWGLVIKEPRDVAVAPAMAYGAILVGLGVLVVILVFVLLWTGVRQVAVPIGALSEQTSRLAVGQEVIPIKSSGIIEIDTLSHAFGHMAGQIASYRSSLRRYIGLITQSQEDERQRIARELHDETVQNLLAITRRVELQQATETDPDRLAQLVELKIMITNTLDGVRQISHDLRPPLLEDLGLIPALRTLVGRLCEDGPDAPEATFEVTGQPVLLGTDHELVLYRVAQEALTNIRKHAQAAHVVVDLAFAPDVVRLDIRDDGRGFTVPGSVTELGQRGRFGLMGIHERVWSVGGELSIHSSAGAGTWLRVTIPMNHRAA